MSSDLSNEHAGRGLQEEARGVLADNTGTNHQPKTKKENSQLGREAINVGETIHGGSSKSDHWSSGKSSNLRELTSHAYKFQLLSLTRRFRKMMLMARKPQPSLKTRPLLQKRKSILVKLEPCSPPRRKRMGKKQSCEQNSGTIHTSTTQSAGSPRDGRT